MTAINVISATFPDGITEMSLDDFFQSKKDLPYLKYYISCYLSSTTLEGIRVDFYSDGSAKKM